MGGVRWWPVALVVLTLIVLTGQLPAVSQAAVTPTPVRILFLPGMNGPMPTPIATPTLAMKLPGYFSAGRIVGPFGDRVDRVGWGNPTASTLTSWVLSSCRAAYDASANGTVNCLTPRTQVDSQGAGQGDGTVPKPGANTSGDYPVPSLTCFFLVFGFSDGTTTESPPATALLGMTCA